MSDEQFISRLFYEIQYALNNNLPINDNQWDYLEQMGYYLEVVGYDLIYNGPTMDGLLPEEKDRAIALVTPSREEVIPDPRFIRLKEPTRGFTPKVKSFYGGRR